MFKKIVQNLIYLTVFSLPFYIVRFDFWGIPITLLEVILLITFIVWGVELFYSSDRNDRLRLIFSQKSLIFLIILFFIASIISVFITSVTSIFLITNASAALGIWKAYIIEPIMFFAILLDFLRDREEPNNIFYVLLATGVVVSFVAFGQKITGVNVYAPGEIAQGRVTGFFNSANSLSLFLAPIALMSFARVLSLLEKGRLKIVEMLLIGVSFIFFLLVIFMTQSAGGMLGVIVGVISIIFFYLQSRYHFLLGKLQIKTIIVFLLSFYLLANVAFLLYLPNLTPNLSERPLTRVYDNTITVRFCLWEGSVDLIKQMPLTGAGLSGFPETYRNFVTCDPELLQYPHNLLLTFWVELGILGVISMGGLLVLAIIQLFKNDTFHSLTIISWLQLGLVGVFTYYLIHGLVDVPYFKNDLSVMWWIFLAFCFRIPDHQALDQT